MTMETKTINCNHCNANIARTQKGGIEISFLRVTKVKYLEKSLSAICRSCDHTTLFTFDKKGKIKHSLDYKAKSNKLLGL